MVSAMQGTWPSIKEFKGRFQKIKKLKHRKEDGDDESQTLDQQPAGSGAEARRPRLMCSIPLMKVVKNELKCVLCRTYAPSREVLGCHVQDHFKKPPYRCKYCRVSLPNSEAMRQHVNLRHRHGRVCELCGSRFRKRADVREHLGAVHAVRFAVPISGGKRNVKSGGRGRAPLFCCLCREDFYTPAGLDLHVFVAHPGVGPFQCQQCPLRFEKEENLAGHFLFAHTSWPTKDLMKLEF